MAFLNEQGLQHLVDKINVRSSKTLPDNAPDGTIIIDPDECSKGFNVSMDVDTALSATSTNPVQNKTVKTALDNKHDKNANVLVGIANYRSLGFNDKYCLQFDANTIGQNPVGMKVIINGNDTGRLVGENAFTNDNYAFTGASDYDNGEAGLVPAPTVDEYDYFLKGDGSWAEIPQPTVTVDAELSSTSTNPVQNKVIHSALANKLTTADILSGFALLGGATNIRWREGTQFVGSINAANYSGTARAATYDGAGNNIVDTYAKKTDIPNITVDAELSDTSTNPIQNKVVKTNMDSLYNNVRSSLNVLRSEIPTKVSALENDAGYLTQHQSLDGYAKTSVVNIWTEQQNFHDLMLYREKYTTYVVNGTSYTPTTSTILCTATGAFTLDLSSISSKLATQEATVFTAYIKSDADYTLTITNAGTIKYIGSASDVAITSAGLLLNIMMLKDASGNVTSIVQASKLS